MLSEFSRLITVSICVSKISCVRNKCSAQGQQFSTIFILTVPEYLITKLRSVQITLNYFAQSACNWLSSSLIFTFAWTNKLKANICFQKVTLFAWMHLKFPFLLTWAVKVWANIWYVSWRSILCFWFLWDCSSEIDWKKFQCVFAWQQLY